LVIYDRFQNCSGLCILPHKMHIYLIIGSARRGKVELD
jgi:hypothetical protein